MDFFLNLFIHYILNINFILHYYLKNYYVQFEQIIFIYLFINYKFFKKYSFN